MMQRELLLYISNFSFQVDQPLLKSYIIVFYIALKATTTP